MEIFEKAKELGDMISDSPELMILRKAEEDILKDPEALKIFNDFGAVRQEYVDLMHETDDQEKLEEMKEKLVAKNNELFNNTITKTYIDAKAKVDNIFKTVTDILMRSVNGDQGEEEGGCSSSDCGGCSCGCK